MENSDDIYVAFTYTSGTILVVGVLFNGVVCITFLAYRSLLTQGNIFIFSIAVSDLLCCAVAVPTSLISNINKRWVFDESGCAGYAFLVTLCGVVSLTHLAALAYDRYEAITLRSRKLLSSNRSVYRVVSVLWIYSFLFAIAPVTGWSRYATEGIGTSCAVDWQSTNANAVSFTITIFIFCFAIPVGVILFSYYNVYKNIRTMTKNANNTWGKMSALARETAKTERKMAIILLTMIIAFLLAWTPYAVVSLISACGGFRWISPLEASIPAYIAKTSSLYNPIIYFFMYKRFRNSVARLFRIESCTRFKENTRHDLHMTVHLREL